MQKNFMLPASLMFGGIILFVLFLVFLNSETLSLSLEIIFGLVVGGMVTGSAFACLSAGGPSNANIFRAVLLLVMGGLSFWLVGNYSTVIFALATIVTAVFTVKPKQQPETA